MVAFFYSLQKLMTLNNSNTDSERLKTLEELLSLCNNNNLELEAGKHIIFSCDFNLYLTPLWMQTAFLQCKKTLTKQDN